MTTSQENQNKQDKVNRKQKNKPLENLTLLLVIRTQWQEKLGRPMAISAMLFTPCSAQTEHFTPTTLTFPGGAVWHQHSHSARLQGLILPVHPSGHLTPAKPQPPAGNAGSFAKENKDLTLAHGHPLVLPPHFQACTEKALQGAFLSYQRNSKFITCQDEKRATKLLWVLSCAANSAGTDLLEHSGYCEQHFSS